MKELSIEEKAKAYDDAIERAKRMFSEKELNYLFPELAESDDEKIRKEILDYIDKTTGCKRWVAWLEQQGEQKVSYTTIVETGDGGINALVTRELPTNGDQKPDDKNEPKFKVGDWVVRGDTIAQILDIQEQYYIGLDINGKDFTSSRFLNDDKIHIWTISDAKDGDVLAVTMYPEGTWIGIFKEQNGCTFSTYCFLNTVGTFKRGTYGHGNGKSIHPATKEQSDQLKKAMADAGYTFDFEKKELKEIEQKPPIVNFKARDWYVNKVDGKIYNAKFMEEPLTNQKRRLEIEKAAMSATGIIEQEEWFIKGAEWSDKNPSYISSEKQGEQKSFDYENANIPQKDSTWSEKDKHLMQKVIDFMNHPDLIKSTPTLAKDTINWLKSLKDRVQPQSKQEWSEEDESNFQMLIDVIKENKHHATDYEHMTYYKLLSWFKSLKERYVWKPSDEHIDALEHFVRSIGESGFATPYDDNTRLLHSLLKQLKKLKG